MEFPRKDEILVRDIRRGGLARKQALEIIFKQAECKKSIFKIVLSGGGTEELAMEVMNESMIILDRQIRRNKFKADSSLFTYFIGIAKWHWWSMKRKQIKEKTEELPEHIPESEFEEPYLSVYEQELRNLLKTLLGQLGDPCKEILSMWAHQHSGIEIARKMNYYDQQNKENAQRAKKEVYRCKVKLSKMVRSNPGFLQILEQFR